MISCHFHFMSYKITPVIFAPEFPIRCIIRCAVGQETELQSIWFFHVLSWLSGAYQIAASSRRDSKSRRDSAEDLVFIAFGFDCGLAFRRVVIRHSVVGWISSSAMFLTNIGDNLPVQEAPLPGGLDQAP